jgi:aspartate/methionine/tyrosine aminotransferase
MFGARTVRFDRSFATGFALDPDRVRAAMTPRTKVIVITTPHNPTGVPAAADALDEIGRIAERAGAHVVVDEVYKDVTGDASPAAASRGDVFITTSSLTKSYGLSSLRAGWTIASPEITYRIQRARDVVDGTGSIVAERLAVLAFEHLDALRARGRAIFSRNKALADAFLASHAAGSSGCRRPGRSSSRACAASPTPGPSSIASCASSAWRSVPARSSKRRRISVSATAAIPTRSAKD